MGNYTIPENPIYDEEIRKLENNDPANAELTFDPLFSKMITNVAAVKRSVDKTSTSIDELGTAARKNVGAGANDVATGNHNHDLAYTAKSHSTDTTLHITSVERTSWNSKETTAGAQAKADSAKNSAIATAATDATAKANTAEANAKSISGQALNEHATDNIKHITNLERTNWNGKANTSVATTSVNGLMSSPDKTKIDGIAIQANNYVHPASHPASMITGLPSSLPANGGNAATVNGKTVESNVPTNAKFTDTVYTHPNDANTRHVTDAEKTTWNGKANTAIVTTTANGLMTSADKVKLNGIATSANNYSHPAIHPASMITGLPTSLPASGGNAATVNGKTVESNVPVNAKFTDTIYTHPNDANTRHVSDTEKAAWNAKANATVATTSANGLMAALDKTKLDGVAVQANKTVIANNLATVSTGTALDAAQGKVLADQIGGLSATAFKINSAPSKINFDTYTTLGVTGVGYTDTISGTLPLSADLCAWGMLHVYQRANNAETNNVFIQEFVTTNHGIPNFLNRSFRRIINTEYKPTKISAWTELLTDQTGVKRSGDVISGNLSAANLASQQAVYFAGDMGNESSHIGKALIAKNARIVNQHADGKYTEFSIYQAPSNADVAHTLRVYCSVVNREYKIYGEHNPPYVIGQYTGDGTVNRTIYLGFRAGFILVTTSQYPHILPVPGTANGFIVGNEANTNGSVLTYIAFK